MVKKRYYAGAGILTLIVLLVIFLNLGSSSYASLSNYDGEVTFHKSMSCGCCGLHLNYVKGNGGLNPEIMVMDDVDEVKDKYGVPGDLRSCHTMIIDGYFVEGHIPLEAVDKLIREKTDIKGITLPGMPSGSPGMPGAKNSEWTIYAVNKDGTTYEFMKI